jgi:hypothetical protein
MTTQMTLSEWVKNAKIYNDYLEESIGEIFEDKRLKVMWKKFESGQRRAPSLAVFCWLLDLHRNAEIFTDFCDAFVKHENAGLVADDDQEWVGPAFPEYARSIDKLKEKVRKTLRAWHTVSVVPLEDRKCILDDSFDGDCEDFEANGVDWPIQSSPTYCEELADIGRMALLNIEEGTCQTGLYSHVADEVFEKVIGKLDAVGYDTSRFKTGYALLQAAISPTVMSVEGMAAN